MKPPISTPITDAQTWEHADGTKHVRADIAKAIEVALVEARELAEGLRAQIHDLCHDMHIPGPVTPAEFCKGCENFQVKLFGRSPAQEIRSFAQSILDQYDRLDATGQTGVNGTLLCVQNYTIENLRKSLKGK
jgi:hypothetical protein